MSKKFFFGGEVVLLITVNFSLPEFCTSTRQSEKTAGMAVPEAPVNKYDGPIFWQDQIRSAAKLSVMKPITKSKPVKTMANCQFRFGVPRPDA